MYEWTRIQRGFGGEVMTDQLGNTEFRRDGETGILMAFRDDRLVVPTTLSCST